MIAFKVKILEKNCFHPLKFLLYFFEDFAHLLGTDSLWTKLLKKRKHSHYFSKGIFLFRWQQKCWNFFLENKNKTKQKGKKKGRAKVRRKKGSPPFGRIYSQSDVTICCRKQKKKFNSRKQDKSGDFPPFHLQLFNAIFALETLRANQ